MAAGSYARMLASSADRDRALEVLRTSFVEGRLTRDELDHRAGQVLVSRWFGDLMTLTADLPVGPFGRLPAHPAVPVPPRMNRLAVVRYALVLGWMTVLLAAVAALLAA